MAKKETVVVEGTMYWPSLTKENEFSPGKHSFDLCNLTDAALDKIASLGSKVKPRTKEGQEERGKFYTLKQSTKMGFMRFKDKAGKPYEDEELEKLGNGTKVRVSIGSYKNDFGVFLSFEAGRVIEPVWYEVDDGLGDDDEAPAAKSDDLDDDLPWGEEEL